MHLDIFDPRLLQEFRENFFDPASERELCVTLREGAQIRRRIRPIREKELTLPSPEN